MKHDVHLGFAVGSGDPVAVPIAHMAVTGQTQQSGKTTTLEAMVTRAGVTALTFVTKRGESSFANGRPVAPYFRDRADWQFVTSILDATLQEKNKFLRPWIMNICRTTKTLAEVQRKVREALLTAKGLNQGVYTQLDAYLDLIVPEIARAKLAAKLDLKRGMNVMDVSSFSTPMQMLFVQSALDWVNEHCHDTVVVIPEAWEFIPEGKGSPVKASATTLVRKGAGIGNFIWIDSQDMAGVDKVILRGCTVWIVGVQREANEIKRTLANIPAGIERPKPSDVALLERGEFYACFKKTVIKTYVQPAWMDVSTARVVALGLTTVTPLMRGPEKPKEIAVNEAEAQALRDENADLRRKLEEIKKQLPPEQRTATATTRAADEPVRTNGTPVDMEEIFVELRRRAATDPVLLRIIASKPEIEVQVERRIVQIDGTSLKGRVARLLANGFMDEGVTQGATRAELRRTGPDVNTGNLSRTFSELLKDGFLTLESGDRYKSVPDMKVNVVER